MHLIHYVIFILSNISPEVEGGVMEGGVRGVVARKTTGDNQKSGESLQEIQGAEIPASGFQKISLFVRL